MNSIFAYVPVLPIIRPPRCCVSTRANEPTIPPTAVALYQRAARAARIYLEESASNNCGEIEFPSVSKDDGSASARDRERKTHAQLAFTISEEVVDSSVIVFNEGTRRLVADGGCRTVTKYPNYAQGSSVLVAVAPSAEEEWGFLENLCRNEGKRVIIANGVFHNGLEWIEPIFYIRPCSGWGFLIREYPGNWEAVSGRTGKPLNIEISLLSQGRFRRPDLPTASKALQRDYYA